MKKLTKRVLTVLLIACMVVGLTACGGGKGKNILTNEDAKKYVYHMQELDVNAAEENENIRAACYANGRIYALLTRYEYEEMQGMVVCLVSFKPDGSDLERVELFSTLKPNPNYVEPGEPLGAGDEDIDIDDDIDDDMGVMPLSASSSMLPVIDAPLIVAPEENEGAADTEETTEETEETTEEVDEAEEESGTEDGLDWYYDNYMSSYTLSENGCYIVMENSAYAFDEMGDYVPGEYSLVLYAFALDGTEKFQAVISDSNESYVYINTMVADEKGNVALISGGSTGTVYIYDAQGNQTAQIDLSAQQLGYVSQAFVDKDGKLNMLAYDNNYTKMSLYRYNMQTGAYEDEGKLLDTLNNYGVSTGKSYDFILTNSMGIYGYNMGDEDVTQILSYLNSDLDYNTLGNIYEMDGDQLFCTYYDQENWSVHFALLNYVDPETIPDKQVISIACYYLDWDMRRRIVEFNRSSDTYRILVKDYSSYSTMDDYTAGYTRLNNDILTGQMPDILVLDRYYMPVDSYIAKGLLADIGKMIDEDEELNREDYFENVFEAYSVKGVLYSVIPSFNIRTVAAKTALVGDTPGWTMEDLWALQEQFPDARIFEEGTTQSTIMYQILTFSGSKFIDSATGKCSFDSQEFIDLLEFVKQFPAEFDWESVEYDYIENQLQYRNNKTLLCNVYIYGFDSWDGYTYASQVTFGEPITFIGFPTQEGNGAVVRASSQYAISARSSVKEGAWEFLRYYLTEDYQRENIYYSLPILKDLLLERLEEAKERPYWEDEDGNKNYYDNSFYIAEEEFTFVPLTDAEAEWLYEYISSVNKADYYDENLEEIISEEAAAFFAGQKTAAEVADIIQSRAQIYINESR
ncbi:MAG: extracellular solute-binding protein [Lachnospiraceae bacterium]|nr:extracellular solute-binding protein [Lachnospiraceae bacterium]